MTVAKTKQCHTCNKKLPGEAFYRIVRSKSGLSSNCRVCHNTITKTNPKRRRDIFNTLNGYTTSRKKQCSVCSRILPALPLYFGNPTPTGLKPVCLLCQNPSTTDEATPIPTLPVPEDVVPPQRGPSCPLPDPSLDLELRTYLGLPPTE